MQVGIFISSSLLQMVYIGACQPFEDPFKNRLELLNEFTVLIVSVLLPAFTDFYDQDDIDVQYAVGWFVLSVIVMQCLFNFSL